MISLRNIRLNKSFQHLIYSTQLTYFDCNLITLSRSQYKNKQISEKMNDFKYVIY